MKDLFHFVIDFFNSLACPCAIFEEFRNPLRDIQLEYYAELNELLETGRYDTRDDFTVVLQTMFLNMELLLLVRVQTTFV